MDNQPELLWTHFRDLCKIPRASANEAGVRAYIKQYSTLRGFQYHEDSTGNCLVSVPGRGRGVGAPAITIQAHMDMVCVRDEGVEHDFTKDPILLRETAWTEKGITRQVVMGTGTTLGADNGIGLVSGLAVALDESLTDCPPLELLFTIDEERGLTGAMGVDPELLRTDLLINLDTEELGEICISCAGGRDLTAFWPVTRETVAGGTVPVRVFLTGLPGGHSGVQIHEGRGNAILMLLEALLQIPGLAGVAQLASFTAGSARNVIPSTAEIVLWVPESMAKTVLATFEDPALAARIEASIRTDKEQKVVTGAESLKPDGVPLPISTEATVTILTAMEGVPNGVLVMSDVVPGLVETSNNVALVGTTEDEVRLQCSTRSSRVGAIEEFQNQVTAQLAATGATVQHSDGYPGWPADADNPLLVQAEKTFERVLGKAPKVMAVHAGLECGVLKGKRPSLQMISFGPDIFGAHTVNERIALDSVPPFYACLTELLKDLAVGE